MSYSPHTAADRERMLAVIGVGSVDDLFADIPTSDRAHRFELPAPLAEQEVRAELARLAGRNRIPAVSFLGAGVYRHLVPSVVSEVIGRAEFSTSYTPYQPEVSQGTLQSIYEFQSLICELTDMEVATASHYDGATATAEAALMACRLTGRHRVAVSTAVNPQVRRVLATYCTGPGIEIVEVGADVADGASGLTPLDAAAEALKDDCACLIAQQPNMFGGIEPMAQLADAAHAAGALLVAVVEPTSLALLSAPGSYGADIVAAEGQPLGIPPSYGGPYVGLMAARMESVRQMPGRLVGATRDGQGRKGYVLTLQAREQHIRREKAASNICTNQALCALAAATFLSAVGPEGLREIADLSATQARHVAAAIEAAGLGQRRFSGPYFAEVAIRVPDAARRHAAMAESGIVAGYLLERDYPELADTLLLAATELTTDADIEALVEALGSTR
ncbi:MAG TPA: aminomethyl-transferring glycine dehydrogenase subunit GcvPA [Candidatus Limnocylindria bacterium]|jgi:glycine dehydrogenase subunit 1|nr:aminomethyl-transferring glycine dehydrogenase subunit GcvPA [Candidatus Limnocylindria bacterium]